MTKSLFLLFGTLYRLFLIFRYLFHDLLIQNLSTFADHSCDSEMYQYFAILLIFEIFIDLFYNYQRFSISTYDETWRNLGYSSNVC